MVLKKMTNITTITLPYVFQLFDFFHVFHGFIIFFGGDFSPTTSLLSVLTNLCLNKSNFTNSVVRTVFSTTILIIVSNGNNRCVKQEYSSLVSVLLQARIHFDILNTNKFQQQQFHYRGLQLEIRLEMGLLIF